MRALMYTWEYPPHLVGGLGSHVAHLAPALIRQGVEVHVITPRLAGGPRLEDISIDGRTRGVVERIEPPFRQLSNFDADVEQTNLNLAEAGAACIRDRGADIIHAHDWLVASASLTLKRLYKIPLVSTVHATERGRSRGTIGGDLSEAINGAEWWLTYESWRVICTSRFMAREISAYFHVPADKIDVVPNGVDSAPFDALDALDLTDFRRRFADPGDQIVFHVGRLVHEKGPQLIVEAAPAVLSAVASARFVVAGNGPMLGYLQSQAWRLGVGQSFYFPGRISDEVRNRLYKVAQCAVFPSLYEPFGIVALEAMAAQCPVVVANTGGLSEVVENHRTGIVVEPDHVGSLAWGIAHTLAHPGWARARAANAYQKVREDYNWDKIAQQTVAVYQRVIDERRQVAW